MSEIKQPKIRFKGYINDWEQRKLGEISESYSGGTPTAGKKEYYDGEIPFIRSGEINQDYTELFINDDGLNNSSAKMVDVGDILYALYGATSGEVGISRIKGAINQAVMCIKPKDRYNAYVITYWLKKEKESIIGKYLQGGQGNLSGGIVKNLDLFLPKNLEEQEKIGEFFKTLDDTIALHEKKLEVTKQFKQTMLKKMFPKNGQTKPEIRFKGFTDDWEERKLGNLLKTESSKQYITEANVGDYPVIQQGDKSVLGYSNKKPFSNFNNVVLFGDHTLSLFKPITPFLVATDGVKILSSDNLEGNFLYAFLQKYKPESQGYKRHFTILKNETGKFPINTEEQTKIGEFFKTLDDTIALHQQKLEVTKKFKQTMLRKMFI